MRYYFDHNACTPVDARVLERFLAVEQACPANPGSLHASGRRARAAVEAAREHVAGLLAVDSEQVFFVSGGTEANNLAVLGGGDRTLPVLCAGIEHPSVLRSAARRGIESWRVSRGGVALVQEPDRPVGLIALAHGQNEVGSLQPIAAAGALADELAVPLHVDASQTLGRCALDEVLRFATTITLSTHKAAGMRGMAILIDRSAATAPLFFGGGQQRGRRPGTESPALAAATALALELALAEREERARAMRAARAAFAAALAVPAHRLTPADSLPNTLMLHFEGLDGRQLLPALDIEGVEASQGSACSSGSPLPPPVLEAIGLDATAARACVRFSFSAHTTADEASAGGRIVGRVVARLRR